MNQLLKLTKPNDKGVYYLNAIHIVYMEGVIKQNSVAITIIHTNASTEPKIFVTETPDQINEMLAKMKKQIVLQI